MDSQGDSYPSSNDTANVLQSVKQGGDNELWRKVECVHGNLAGAGWMDKPAVSGVTGTMEEQGSRDQPGHLTPTNQ